MALRLTTTPYLPPYGGDVVFSGTPTLTASVDDTGTLTDPAEIARIEFVDTAYGMHRILPPEEMVSPNLAGAELRAKWKGQFPPAVRTQTEQDRPGEWDYRYATWHEWGRVVHIAAVAYDAEGREIGRATLAPGRIANYGGWVVPIQLNEALDADVPAEMRRPQSGIVTMVVRAKRVDQLVAKDGYGDASPGLGEVLNANGGGASGMFFSTYVDEEWHAPVTDPLHYALPEGAAEPRLSAAPQYTSPFWSKTGASEVPIFIDTRRFSNGRHRVKIYCRTAEPWPMNRHHVAHPKSQFTGADLDGMTEDLPFVLEFDITTFNGRTPMAIVPSLRDVWATPGESVTLSYELLHTDGFRRALTQGEVRLRGEGRLYLGTTMWRDGRTIATTNGFDVIDVVDTPGLDARTFFTAELTRYDGVYWHPVRKAEIEVRVRPQDAFAHFRRGVGPTSQFGEGSAFLANMFQLGPHHFQGREAAYVDEVTRVGINALNLGIFLNGGGIAAIMDQPTPEAQFDTWKAMWEATIGQYIPFFQRNPELAWYGAADDIGRSRAALKWTNDTPWAMDAISYAVQRLLDEGVVVATDVFDEASMIFPGGPIPPEGLHWSTNTILPERDDDPAASPQTSIRRTIVADIAEALRNTTGAQMPIAFPILGAEHPFGAYLWMGDGPDAPSTFGSAFWTAWDRQRPDYYVLNEVRGNMEASARRWMLSNARPNMLQVSASGPFYHKMTAGDHFKPGWDFSLLQTYIGTHEDQLPLSVWLAVIEGFAGVRVYVYEDFNNPNNPRNSHQLPVFGEVQTGVSDICLPNLWNAMGNGLSLVHELTDLVLQPNRNAPYLDRLLSVGVKSGDAGRLLVISNWADERVTTSTAPLQLADYAGGTMVRLTGQSRETTPLAADSGSLVVGAHEVVVIYKRAA